MTTSLPESARLVDSYVQLRPFGRGEVLSKHAGKTRKLDATLVWDPDVEGLLVSEAQMTRSSRHRGERHLDADELVYLVSGAAEIALEQEDGSWASLLLAEGEAVVVPQGGGTVSS
jgi:CRP-like cAMP-binding protein